MLLVTNGLKFLIVFNFGRNDAFLGAEICAETALRQVSAVVGAEILCGLDAHLQLLTNTADVITGTGLRHGLVITCDAESGMEFLYGLGHQQQNLTSQGCGLEDGPFFLWNVQKPLEDF